MILKNFFKNIKRTQGGFIPLAKSRPKVTGALASRGRLLTGFTLIETVIAILILSLSIGALLNLAAGGYFSVRYARNQIVAENLAQEALEYLRNERDSAVQQGVLWQTWEDSLPASCFDTTPSGGCNIDPYAETSPIVACSAFGTSCPVMLLHTYVDQNQQVPSDQIAAFYGYDDVPTVLGAPDVSMPTTYVRKITMDKSVVDQLVVTATITWRNGSYPKTTSKTMLLTGWTP